MTPAQVRDFLIAREAVLVHFSTVMARDPSLVLPNDLKRAMTLRGAALAFSTIQVGDQFNPSDSGRGGAEGSIGMLVDVAATTRVVKVHSSDMGSVPDSSGNADGLGSPPTPESCAQSIDDRERSNEWLVRDYEPLGIFLLRPLLARVRSSQTEPAEYAEAPVDFRVVVDRMFPDERIFSANPHTFLEFDRDLEAWKAIGIKGIYR